VLGGLRPWALSRAPAPPARQREDRASERPFRSVDGLVGGVPLTLRVQNEMDPSDPDNHAHVDHRIALGFEGGSLTLHGTHGPLVLSERPRYPHGPRDPGSAPHFGRARGDAAAPSARALGAAAAPGYEEAFHALWPAAVRHALGELRTAIEAGDCTPRGQAHLATCLLWQDLTAQLGPPELVRRPPFRPFAPRLLAAAEAAARAGA
jgi:pyochelin biosynthesis protein PchG